MQLVSGDRVLITGGCGFIGSALSREIQANYEDVHIRVIDNLCNGAVENIEELGIEFIEGDILDDNKAHTALDKVDVLFHLAALPFIPHSYEDPGSYFKVNAGGSMELFVRALSSRVRRIVYVSTCEVYGVAESFPISESHPTNPVSIYAASKLAAEKAAYALYKEHGLPVVILRPFNTYGPRDSFPRIIPDLISQFNRSNELKVGNIEACRDFNYVGDIARGILLAANTNEAVGKVFNLCSGDEISVRELVSLVALLSGSNDYSIEIETNRLRPSDVDRFLGDGTQARNVLNWEPEVSLQEGIGRTIDWYRQAGRWKWEQ